MDAAVGDTLAGYIVYILTYASEGSVKTTGIIEIDEDKAAAANCSSPSEVSQCALSAVEGIADDIGAYDISTIGNNLNIKPIEKVNHIISFVFKFESCIWYFIITNLF